MLPPPTVCAAFGAPEGVPEPLPGGRGRSVRLGDVVLKPVDDVAVAAWAQRVTSVVPPGEIELPRPILSSHGRWVSGGWSATAYVPNLRPVTDWPRVAGAGRALSAALTEVAGDVAELLAGRRDRWCVADRVAWGETTVDLPPAVMELVHRLARSLPDAAGHEVVVHGDLAGNTFERLDGRLVVLDLSAYLRPIELASAVVAVDAILWSGAPPSCVELIDADREAAAALIDRAVVFRLVAEQLGVEAGSDIDIGPYERLLDAVGAILGQSSLD